MTKKLVLSDGIRERELHLVGRIVVGRDPSCEISHDDSLLSRRHAEFVTSGTMVTVKDLGSRNGVFVNGTRASEHTLEPGDVVQIGPLRARFVVDGTPRSLSPEAMDLDRTNVFRKASPVAAAVAAPIHPAVALAFEEIDEDATRLVPAPRPAVEVPDLPLAGLSRVHEAADDEDEDMTRFKAAPVVARRPVTAPLAPPARIAPAEPAAPRPPAVHFPATPHPLDAFVYKQMMALALIIVGAGGVAVLMWMRSLSLAGIDISGSSTVAWFALPIVAAIVATYVIGAAVNRRIGSALDARDRART